MNDATRKAVLVAYQNRKKEPIVHPFLGESVAVGLLPHLQARLLARHLRGDLDAYMASVNEHGALSIQGVERQEGAMGTFGRITA